MIKHKTFIDELKAKAKVLSQGEAVILFRRNKQKRRVSGDNRFCVR